MKKLIFIGLLLMMAGIRPSDVWEEDSPEAYQMAEDSDFFFHKPVVYDGEGKELEELQRSYQFRPIKAKTIPSRTASMSPTSPTMKDREEFRTYMDAIKERMQKWQKESEEDVGKVVQKAKDELDPTVFTTFIHALLNESINKLNPTVAQIALKFGAQGTPAMLTNLHNQRPTFHEKPVTRDIVYENKEGQEKDQLIEKMFEIIDFKPEIFHRSGTPTNTWAILLRDKIYKRNIPGRIRQSLSLQAIDELTNPRKQAEQKKDA